MVKKYKFIVTSVSRNGIRGQSRVGSIYMSLVKVSQSNWSDQVQVRANNSLKIG